MTSVQWNAQQEDALRRIAAWMRDTKGSQVFRLFGYAGTGKTTLARHVAAQESGRTLFAAYTGKAASVLRANGCDGATTLHQLIYTAIEGNVEAVWALERELATLVEAGVSERLVADCEARLAAARTAARRPSFVRNEDSALRGARLLVLDEVSMVDKALARDILSFGTKVLVLGDPGQLPPITGTGYFVQTDPEVLLTEIHRQAADNPIIQWATMARNGIPIPLGVAEGGLARKTTRDAVDDAWLMRDAGQILCGRNESRQALNARVRSALGHTRSVPEHSDVLVCLRNNHRLGLMNGTLCSTVQHAYYSDHHTEPTLLMNVMYEGRLIRELPVCPRPFAGAPPALDRRDALAFDYGYAITVHKAQGSQWPTVTLWDDGFGKRDPQLRARWLYTAITRAQTRLHIITNRVQGR